MSLRPASSQPFGRLARFGFSPESLTEVTTLEVPLRPSAKLEMNGTDDFVSPFEEEYDVPAFIRRSREAD